VSTALLCEGKRGSLNKLGSFQISENKKFLER